MPRGDRILEPGRTYAAAMAQRSPSAGSASAATDAADLGVLEAAAGLRARRLSARELLAAVLARIEARNGGAPTFDGAGDAVNAWARLYPELAEAMARAADERIAREGEAAPLLCGVPIGLKDLYSVKGLPVTASSRVLADNVAAEDSAVWARLAANGMVLVGHTHTHEFAFGGTSDQVGNPWALDRSAGGSSGGSGAALAARMVPAATGTDTAGSLRIPAALSGVSSIKATHGRVPMTGVIPLAATFDHAGPMARSLADCSLLLGAMTAAGSETSPLMPPPAAMGNLSSSPRPGPRPLDGLRVGLLPPPPGVELDPDVADGVEAAAAACRRLGAEVIEPQRPALASLDDFYLMVGVEVWSFHERFAHRAEHYRPFLREILAGVREAGPAAEYVRAQCRRAELTAVWERWLAAEAVDLVLEPTVPMPAPPRTLGYEPVLPTPDPLILLTFTWDMTGFPALALPAGLGRRSGLPVGVSLIAPRGREAPLLQAGIDLQQHELEPPRVA
jgi:aspartyl-tRNA(Asn)/glutamyl-tRNA(Gln) amidotransferase subunit A